MQQNTKKDINFIRTSHENDDTTTELYGMSNFKSNQNTFSIPCSIDYFRFGPGIGWYRYQVIGNRPSLPLAPCLAQWTTCTLEKILIWE
jgi:hypothetical protein